MSSGTMTIPPPTPKSAPKNPAARPMRTRRTGLFYERGFRPPGSSSPSDPAEAAILLDVDGTLAPIVAEPEEASVPEETRAAALAGSSSATGSWRASADGRATDAARVVGVEGVRYVGEHGLELGAGGRGMGRAARRRSRRRRLAARGGKAAHALVPLPVGRRRGQRPRGRFGAVAERALARGVAPALGSARARDPSADRRGQGDCGEAAARRRRPAPRAVRGRRHDGPRRASAASTAWSWPFGSQSPRTKAPTSSSRAADIIVGRARRRSPSSSHSCDARRRSRCSRRSAAATASRAILRWDGEVTRPGARARSPTAPGGVTTSRSSSRTATGSR